MGASRKKEFYTDTLKGRLSRFIAILSVWIRQHSTIDWCEAAVATGSLLATYLQLHDFLGMGTGWMDHDRTAWPGLLITWHYYNSLVQNT